MAIDVRQQGTQTKPASGPGPNRQRQPKWPALLAVLALLAVGGALAVFGASQGDRPEVGTQMRGNPEGPFVVDADTGELIPVLQAGGYGDTGTSTREAGPYLEPETGYGDIGTSTREAGPYFVDTGTDVQTREGGVIVPATTDVQTREG